MKFILMGLLFSLSALADHIEDKPLDTKSKRDIAQTKQPQVAVCTVYYPKSCSLVSTQYQGDSDPKVTIDCLKSDGSGMIKYFAFLKGALRWLPIMPSKIEFTAADVTALKVSCDLVK